MGLHPGHAGLPGGRRPPHRRAGCGWSAPARRSPGTTPRTARTGPGRHRHAGRAARGRAGRVFVTSPDLGHGREQRLRPWPPGSSTTSPYGRPARRRWAGQDVGSERRRYKPLPGGYRPAGGTFTVQGSGDIAPAVASSAGSGRPADAGSGAFAGLIVVIVVGAMFITAEYRRGLIRTTLAASPAPRPGPGGQGDRDRRGHLRRRAGRVGRRGRCSVERMLRGSGNYIFPVGALTEVRRDSGNRGAARRGRRPRPGPRRHPAARRRAGHRHHRADRRALLLHRPAGDPAGRAADWLLRVTPAAAFAVQQVLPAYPQVSNAYIPQYGYYPLAAVGRARGAVRLGRGSPSAWPCSCCAGGTHDPDALSAEWTKIRTLAGTGWLLLGTVAVTVAVSAAVSAAVSCPSGGLPRRPHQAQPHRDLARPGGRGDHGGAGGQRRVRHRHDPHHPGRDAAADRHAGRQGGRRHRPGAGRRRRRRRAARCWPGG